MTKWCLMLLLLTGILYSCNNNNGNKRSVAFYNCENFFDPADDPLKNDDEFTPAGKYHYTEGIYKRKLHNIATVLQYMANEDVPEGPSVIGLAEIENDRVLSDLVNQPEIAGRYHFIWYQGPDKRGINVALLYNPSSFSILKSYPIPVKLHDSSGDWATRGILYVQGIMDKDTVNLLVNHWPSRRGGQAESEDARMQAASIARIKIDSLLAEKPTSKIFVLGDFNDNPDDISIRERLKANPMNLTRLNDLYNPWLAIYEGGKGTLLYQHHWDLFDQIIISGAVIKDAGQWHYDHAEILKKTFLLNRSVKFESAPHRSYSGTHWINGYSDHLPVMLYLSR